MPQSHLLMTDAFAWLKKYISNIQTSHIYSTPPLNGIGDDYFNAVAMGQTMLSFDDINLLLKQFEKQAGRTPESKIKSQIPIDLDIVIYNNQIIRHNDFQQDFFQIGYRQIIK